jgi:hypothetical protein
MSKQPHQSQQEVLVGKTTRPSKLKGEWAIIIMADFLISNVKYIHFIVIITLLDSSGG